MKTFREHDLTARGVPPAPCSSRGKYSFINSRDLVENGGAPSPQAMRPQGLCAASRRTTDAVTSSKTILPQKTGFNVVSIASMRMVQIKLAPVQYIASYNDKEEQPRKL